VRDDIAHVGRTIARTLEPSRRAQEYIPRSLVLYQTPSRSGKRNRLAGSKEYATEVVSLVGWDRGALPAPILSWWEERKLENT
jgi:hypothetical protein